MAKFNASVSVDGNGVLTLILDRVFPELNTDHGLKYNLYMNFYETIAGKKFELPYYDIGGLGYASWEQKNETTFTCALPPDYLATLAGRQFSVEVEVETDGPGDYTAWTTLNVPDSLTPHEPLPEITSITYDPVTRTISAMLSNGQIAEPDQLNFAFIAHYGSNQATVENGSWEYTPEVIGEIIDASIAECNEMNRKYVGTSFCFRVSNCFRVSTDNREYYYNEYGPGRAIYIYPDGSWKDLGTATSAPVAPGKDTTPPEKVTGLAVPVVDGKYKATLSWDTGVDNSGKVANYEIQLDNGKILKSSKTTLNVSNLSVGEHSYRVRAIDKDRNVGEWSEAKTFTVKDMTAPTSVKGKATVDGYTVMFALSGKDNSGSIAKYVVTCGDKSVETTTGTAVLSDFGVGKQTAYVVAYDAEGNASKATKVSFTVKDATPPEKVTGLAVPVVDGKYKATLSWAPGVDNSGKVANYEIQLDNGKILKSSKTTLNVSNLSVGEHSYKVRAIDKDKNVGEWSEVQTFTVKDMTAPTSVKGKATVDGYTVMFALSGKDNSGSIARYVVTCGDKSVETTTDTAVLSDFGVGRQTAYVVAYDAEGNASKETKVSFTVKDATPPEKVTGLAVPVVDGKYKATLSWDTGVDNSGKVANYEIQLDNGRILKSSKTSINVSNLSIGEHTYQVRAVDKDRNVGEWSEVQTFTVKDMTAPTSVKGKATVNGYSVTFALSGKDNSGSIAKYIVTCGDKSVETTTSTAVLSDFGVGRQTAYVVAYDAEGNASKETKVSFTVKDATPPEKVTGLAVPVVDGKYKATLSWAPGVDNSGKVANYEIQLDNGKILKSSKTSINISNLSVGEHSYRVRAIDKDRNVGEWSEIQTFTVKDMTAPNSVKAKATVNGYSVMFALSGKDNSGSIARYVVTCGDKSVETTTGTAVLSDFGVGRQTAYVVAYDAEGNASKETKVSFTVKDATPPEKVTGLAVPVVDSKYKATLSWDTGVDNSGKVANYEIQLDNGKILKSSKTTLNVSNLSVGEHSYRVRAVDKEKNVGEWSEVQTFTVRDMTAPGSVSVKAKVEGNSLLLSWKTPKDNVGVTGYILKHGANLEHTETLTANMLSFQIDGIAKGSYQYQIVAVDAAGNESKAKAGKATIKTELPMAALNLELPDFASLSGFDSDVQAVPELVDDPLAFCHTLELDAELKLSAAEMLGQDDANKRSGTLFAVAS